MKDFTDHVIEVFGDPVLNVLLEVRLYSIHGKLIGALVMFSDDEACQ